MQKRNELYSAFIKAGKLFELRDIDKAPLIKLQYNSILECDLKKFPKAAQHSG